MKISDSGDSIQNTGKRANGRGHNTSIDVAKLAGVSPGHCIKGLQSRLEDESIYAPAGSGRSQRLKIRS